MPDRENAVDISERLCVENAGQYGGLCMYVRMYVCMCMYVRYDQESKYTSTVCMYTSSNEQNVHQDTGLIYVGRLGWFDCMYVLYVYVCKA